MKSEPQRTQNRHRKAQNEKREKAIAEKLYAFAFSVIFCVKLFSVYSVLRISRLSPARILWHVARRALYVSPMRIGLISDTHGSLHSGVFEHFLDVQAILHAGDVCGAEILSELETLAPVTAVVGNCDPPGCGLRMRAVEEFAGVRIGMTHSHLVDASARDQRLVELFAEDDVQIIVHGHSHIARNDRVGDMTFLNPGAACRPRFKDIASIAVLEILPRGAWTVKFIPLEFAPR